MDIAFEFRPKTGRPPKNYDWATEYAIKVSRGEILTSKKNLASAERHLKDLEIGNVLTYQWKPEKAAHIIKFLEMLPDTKTGEPMKLMLFQKYIVGSLYGWVDEAGNRRFTKAYISTARKNGNKFA